MAEPQQTMHSIQLLVEGSDQRNFFNAFISHLSLPDIQIQDFGGVNELRNFLSLLVRLPDFYDTVSSIGIVRDAELSAPSAFQSAQGSLANAGLSVPDRLREPTNSLPSINVLILPDDHNPGMLETLLCRTFENTQIDSCIGDFFDCIRDATNEDLHRPEKARAHAFIATRRDPHISVGVAAQRSYWDLDHAVFDGVRSFLRSL